MPTVSLNLPSGSYDIVIEPGALSQIGELVRDVTPHEKAAVVVDESIEFTHGLAAGRSMKAALFDTQIAVMPTSEEKKNLTTIHHLMTVMLDAKLERRSPIVAVGGGITGDVTGFLAAIYLRGVPFVQCPTTLLAMVDASVGGKTGVNMPHGKNLVGSFHQPRLVLCDPEVLKTLPDRELSCGLAECVKHGMIRDEELLRWTARSSERFAARDNDALVELIERNVRIKAAVVEEDEHESGVRAHLNFGHTFGHALEASTDYGAFKHGEAVSLGMVVATHLAVTLGMCGQEVLDKLRVALEAVALPIVSPTPPPLSLLAAMQQDKKVKDSKIRLVLPTRIGEVVIRDDVPVKQVIDAWGAIKP